MWLDKAEAFGPGSEDDAVWLFPAAFPPARQARESRCSPAKQALDNCSLCYNVVSSRQTFYIACESVRRKQISAFRAVQIGASFSFGRPSAIVDPSIGHFGVHVTSNQAPALLAYLLVRNVCPLEAAELSCNLLSRCLIGVIRNSLANSKHKAPPFDYTRTQQHQHWRTAKKRPLGLAGTWKTSKCIARYGCPASYTIIRLTATQVTPDPVGECHRRTHHIMEHTTTQEVVKLRHIQTPRDCHWRSSKPSPRRRRISALHTRPRASHHTRTGIVNLAK